MSLLRVVQFKASSVVFKISPLMVKGRLSEQRHVVTRSFEYVVLIKRLACWEKYYRRHFEIFSYFSQKIGFEISCKLSPTEIICIKCLSLLSRENMNTIVNLPSANLPQIVVKG